MQTTRCKLDPLQQSDLKYMQRIYSSHEVRKYLGGAVPVEYHLNKFLDALERSSTKESYIWTVRLKENNDFIGVVSLDNHIDGRFKEISYEFLPQSWGSGYAAEVVVQLLMYALHELKLGKVIAETQTANTASCRLLEKVGMRLEHKLQRYGAEQALYSFNGHSGLFD